MNIIDKLGIKPIAVYNSDSYPYKYCLDVDVRELEQQRNEMLEALIYFIKAYEGARDDNHWSKETCDIMKSMIEIYLLDLVFHLD